MSDAFGPDSDGGLQSDMSSRGVGDAPPTPRPVPSPLGGLAQAFQQMFGGRPAPQPAMRGPSPFQFPGRSQIPQPPPGQPQPRWRGTTASLGLPRGAPQPPASFTPYQRSLPTRDPDEWGKPEEFGPRPAAFEVPSLYHGLSQFFGQNGSALSIPLALAMGKHAAAFVQGLQQGQEFRAKMAREQMQDAAMKLQLQQEEEIHAYADIVAQYGALDRGMKKTINGVGVRDALHNQAIQLGDDKMASLIENGANIADIMWFQQQRDANLRDLQKANAKQDEQAALDEQWGLKPASQSGGSFAKEVAAGHDGATPAPSAPASGAAPTAAGGQPPAPAAPAAPTGEAAAGQSNEFDSPIGTGASQIFKGLEPGSYVPPDVKNAMALEASKMRARANQILRDPNIKPEDVIPEVRRQLGDTVAGDLQGYSQYRTGPGATGQASGGKEQDYWSLLGDLAQKAHPGDPKNAIPGWSKSTYQAVRDFREQAQKPNSPIQRIPTVVEAANNVLADLDAIQKRDGLTANQSPISFSAFVGKDDLAAQLKIDWIRYNEDVDVLTRGTPSVGMAEQAIRVLPQIPLTGSIASYRAAVRRDMDQARSRVLQMHGTWDQYRTGDPMPGYNPKAEADMDAIRKLDPTSGARPGEVRGGYRYLGVNPENPGGDRANWEVAK